MDHDHWAIAVAWLRSNWYWLAGVPPVLWYTTRWYIQIATRTTVFSKHPTHEDLQHCKDRLEKQMEERFTQELKQHEEREFAKISAHRQENTEQHKELHSEISGIRVEMSELMRLMIGMSKK